MTLSHMFILSVVAGSIYFGTGKQSAAEAAPDPHHSEHKWACTPTSLMWPNEAPARGVGAPACKAGYAATEWLCLSNQLIHPENRGITQEGQPKCRVGYTASEQRHLQSEYSPVQVPKQLPPIMRNGSFVPQDQLYHGAKSAKPLVAASTNFFYEVGDYETSTAGVSGNFLVGKPFFAPLNVNGVPYGHTLGQIAAISSQTVASGGTTQTFVQTVELGWTVDGFTNGTQKYENGTLASTVPDLTPHLFVSRSINGNYYSSAGTCYNAVKGCGYEAIPNSAFQAGQELPEGSTVGLAIAHRAATGSSKAGWYMTVTLNGVSSDIGYYKDTLWTDNNVNFVAANDVQWYGEVALGVVNGTMAPATAAMGNGRRAEIDTDAATVTNTQIINSSGSYVTVNPNVNSNQTINVAGSTNLKASDLYDYYTDASSLGAFRYGGPGLASRSAYIPYCGIYSGGDIYLNIIDFSTGILDSSNVKINNDLCLSTALSQDGKKLYISAAPVANSGTNAVNEILSFNATNGSEVDEISNETGGLALTPDGNTLLVAGDNSSIDVIDANAAHSNTYNTVISKITGLSGYPGSIVIDEDGKTAYVTCVQPDNIAVIDIATLTVVASLDAGVKPSWVNISPDGTWLYIGNQGTYTAGDGSQTVSVIKISSTYKSDGSIQYLYKQEGSITNGGQVPWGIAFTPDSSIAYISWNPLSGDTSGTLTSVDTSTRELTPINPFGKDTTDIYTVGAVGVTPDGRFAYLVTDYGTLIGQPSCGPSKSGCASAVKIDTATNRVLGQIFFPSEPPGGSAAGAFGNFTGGR